MCLCVLISHKTFCCADFLFLWFIIEDPNDNIPACPKDWPPPWPRPISRWGHPYLQHHNQRTCQDTFHINHHVTINNKAQNNYQHVSQQAKNKRWSPSRWWWSLVTVTIKTWYNWTKTMNENLGSLRSSAKTQQSQTPCTMLHSLQLTDPTMLHRSLSQTPRTVFKTACIKIYLDSVTKPTKATFSC